MTRTIRIETTGDVLRVDGDMIVMADVAFDGDVDIVRCRAPQLGVLAPNEVFVGAIDDWGLAKGLPINMKAWALYGGSPIFGPMYFALDRTDIGRGDLPETVIDMVVSDLDDWLAPETKETMERIIEVHYPEAT